MTEPSGNGGNSSGGRRRRGRNRRRKTGDRSRGGEQKAATQKKTWRPQRGRNTSTKPGGNHGLVTRYSDFDDLPPPPMTADGRPYDVEDDHEYQQECAVDKDGTSNS